jgi:hypothetical protein
MDEIRASNWGRLKFGGVVSEAAPIHLTKAAQTKFAYQARILFGRPPGARTKNEQDCGRKALNSTDK